MSKGTEYEEMMREVTAFLIEKALSEKPSSSYFGGKVTATEYACSQKETRGEPGDIGCPGLDDFREEQG